MMKQYLYDNLYQKEVNTKIIDIFELNDKNYVIIENNIFYPQGGGQKGDKGILKTNDTEYKILTTIKHPDSKSLAILCIEEKLSDDLKNRDCTATLDWDFRYKQMRLHGALHLYHYCLEQILGELPYPVLSMINDDGTGVLRYENPAITEEVVAKATNDIKSIINQEIDLITYPDDEKEGFRYWRYNDYIIPCGGTHVKNTSEIGNVSVDFHVKKGQQSLKFTLEN